MILGRFEILDTLSWRNSVQTYKCRDTEFGMVVLKVFESVLEPQNAQLRHLSESLLRLSHPGLQEHLGFFEDGQQVALAFKWIEGQTLAEEIEHGTRYSDAQLFQFLGESLEALAAAHGLEPALVHRDIKPENVVRTPEGWVFIDFGASREAILGDGEVSVIGTTGYAAPEQFFGQALPSSDQYGLAATTLHLATHRHPTEFPLRKLKLEINDAGLSRSLTKVLNRMLAPDPEQRFLNVQTALSAVRSGVGMQDWEFALEPLADTPTILQTTVDGAALEISIGARSNTLKLLLSVMVPLSMTFLVTWFMGSMGVIAYLAIMYIGIVFVLTTLPASEVFHREWVGRRTWLLRLTPTGFRLQKGKRLICEGAYPPEVVAARQLVENFSLDKRVPMKLRLQKGHSKKFGHALSAKESEVLQSIVESYYRQSRGQSKRPVEGQHY